MAEEIVLSSAVSRVEVFRSSALVTRRAWAPVAGRQGRLCCTLGGLPLSLREDSVRIDLSGERRAGRGRAGAARAGGPAHGRGLG